MGSRDSPGLVVQWEDSALPLQGARVRSLVGELDPASMPQLKIPRAAVKIPRAATKTWCSQNKFFLKKQERNGFQRPESFRQEVELIP